MKFGISTLSRGLFTSREAYKAIAQAAESAGFDFLSVNDHLVVPAQLESAYPYTQGGQWSAAAHGHCFDQLTTLAFLAGCTERLRLLTSVMVVPHRAVLNAAKSLATIDVLSGGRLIVGVGAGWMEEEFKLLGAPFVDRGRATDEYLEAFKVLWTEQRPTYEGRHVTFRDVIFQPKPLQTPHPPIWVGGESPAALRRAFKLGDAWYPGNNNQRTPMDTPARLEARIADVKAQCERHGRDPATLGISIIAQSPFQWSRARTIDGGTRAMFSGSSEEMRADAHAMDEAGVAHVAVRIDGASLEEAVDRVARFGAEVIAKVGR